MQQHQFKLEQVNLGLMRELEANRSTHYFAAMTFQLGCAIGELVAMGMSQNDLALACDKLIENAMQTRVSDITKDKG